MFYGYPTKATAENWLHNTLVKLVKTLHTNADQGKPLLIWPDCLPKERRENLKRRHGFKRRLTEYEGAIRRLSCGERQQVLVCLDAQNKIKELLAGQQDCDRLSDLPELARQPISDLFHFAFELIKELGIRDRHYKLIFDATEDHYCPFCCCEPFDAPGGERFALDSSERRISEALDHYLPRDEYPFAAANLCNLVPMGGKCNGYKLNTDLLRSQSNHRRKAFYPYSKQRSRVCLKSSEPIGRRPTDPPSWKILIIPTCPEADTWNEVFSLHTRIERDVLSPARYQRWFKQFCQWFVKEFKTWSPTNAQIVAGLKKYHDNEAIKELNGVEHYRTLVIDMIHHHCSKGSSKLFQRIKATIKEAIPPITQ
jgi:hypothetical protein